MKITYESPDGSKHTAKPTPCGKAVEAPGLCPVCGELSGLVDGLGVTRALARAARIAEARRETEARFGPMTVEAPPVNFRVRMPEPVERYDGWRGRAVCVRCREAVGMLTVTVSTMFGLDEDRAVLCARARVY